MNAVRAKGSKRSAAAKARLLSGRAEPLFFADWNRVLFMHYEVDPEAICGDVPFELDVHQGCAYVSLVAFTMSQFRFRFGGILGRLFCLPIAAHEFLNVRTYVRHRGESGIFFLSEWVPNRLSLLLGPATFGLPYQHGQFRYCHQHESLEVSGRVADVRDGSEFRYSGTMGNGGTFREVETGTLDEFLLERYTAFTTRRGGRTFFRIWHEPWLQIPAAVSPTDTSLLARRWAWFRNATLIGAHYSPGAREVWMGWPQRCDGRHARHAAFLELP